MKKSLRGEAVSRRTLLVTSASVVLLAPVMKPFTPTAMATVPTMTYGHGYTGGY